MIAGGRIVADGPTEQIRSQATGRTVSADLPQAGAAHALARLRGMPHVAEVTTQGRRVTVTSGLRRRGPGTARRAGCQEPGDRERVAGNRLHDNHGRARPGARTREVTR